MFGVCLFQVVVVEEMEAYISSWCLHISGRGGWQTCAGSKMTCCDLHAAPASVYSYMYSWFLQV